MKRTVLMSAVALSVISMSGIAMAADTATTTTVRSTTIAPADPNTAVNAQVETAADKSPVMLTGRIKSVSDDEFVMNYGTGDITVEMDGWQWDEDQTKYLRTGDQVTVTGMIDDDLFEGREVKASNIYVMSDNMYYYSDEAARYPMNAYGDANSITDGSYVTMAGTVSSIEGDEITLSNNSTSAMKVDMGSLGYNALDADGVQQIKVGDMIQVYGEMDQGFFERQEIVASRVISLMSR